VTRECRILAELEREARGSKVRLTEEGLEPTESPSMLAFVMGKDHDPEVCLALHL
jgi:hypothetical protein